MKLLIFNWIESGANPLSLISIVSNKLIVVGTTSFWANSSPSVYVPTGCGIAVIILPKIFVLGLPSISGPEPSSIEIS